jgi:hypothetical protein
MGIEKNTEITTAKKKERKWLKYVLAIFALIVSAAMFLSDYEEAGTGAQNTSNTNAQSDEPDFRGRPEGLVSEYTNNSLAADKKFKDKIVRLTGYPEEIGKNEIGPFVRFRPAELEVESVLCYFSGSYEDQLSNLSKSKEVTIQGTVAGMDRVWVVLKGSRIIR